MKGPDAEEHGAEGQCAQHVFYCCNPWNLTDLEGFRLILMKGINTYFRDTSLKYLRSHTIAFVKRLRGLLINQPASRVIGVCSVTADTYKTLYMDYNRW